MTLTEFSRRVLPAEQARCYGHCAVPVTEQQACEPARAATHDGDGPATRGSWRSTIALWLGHESVETTQIYLDADLAMQQAVLDKTTPPQGKPGRYRPDDRLLAFLKGL